ncbi:hypothetical protein OG474_41230 [Kribbella sp. NBC_01505]
MYQDPEQSSTFHLTLRTTNVRRPDPQVRIRGAPQVPEGEGVGEW